MVTHYYSVIVELPICYKLLHTYIPVPFRILGMGNIQSVSSVPDRDVQQAINKAKEKEIQFNKEVCQEAS